MPRTIHFNTGRQYTSSGQRISATEYEDGSITFNDHDRGIFSAIDAEIAGRAPSLILSAIVLHCYDHGYHHHTTRAMNDATMPGGVNSVYPG